LKSELTEKCTNTVPPGKDSVKTLGCSSYSRGFSTAHRLKQHARVHWCLTTLKLHTCTMQIPSRTPMHFCLMVLCDPPAPAQPNIHCPCNNTHTSPRGTMSTLMHVASSILPHHDAQSYFNVPQPQDMSQHNPQPPVSLAEPYQDLYMCHNAAHMHVTPYHSPRHHAPVAVHPCTSLQSCAPMAMSQERSLAVARM
jgi:hypothetical protein